MQRRPVLLALAVVVAMTAAACGGGSSDDSTRRRSSPLPRNAEERAAAGPGCQFIVAGTERRFTRPLEQVEYLADAVAEPATCYDRITFIFDQGDGDDMPPGYVVEYRKDPFGLEGIPTSTGGFKDAKAVLYVEISPASTTNATSGRGVETYRGNLRLRLADMGHTVIVEWVDKLPEDTTPDDITDDKVVWLIGLDERRPFTVDAANHPPRVSVLVMNDRPRTLRPDDDEQPTTPTQVTSTTLPSLAPASNRP
jgi:hypothetical protein